MKVEIQEKFGIKTIDCQSITVDRNKIECVNVSLQMDYNCGRPILWNVDVELVCGMINIIFPFKRLVSITE